MRRAFAAVLVLLLFGCAKGGGSPAPAPASWTKLPEQGGPTDFAEPSAAFTESVRGAFTATTQALVAASAKPATPEGQWHLGGMMANFTVGLNGMFGLIGFGGATSLEVIWLRAMNHAVKHQSPATVRISPSVSNAELTARIGAMTKLAATTGKVPDNEKVRSALVTRAQSFRDLCATLSAAPIAGGGFHASEVRLELEIDATGTVSPIIGAGGNVVVRFDWDFPESGPVVAKGTPANDPLVALLRGLTQDINAATVANPKLPGTPYGLKQVRLQIGIAENGQFGVVTEAADMIGSLVFEKSEDAVAALPPAADQGPLRYVSSVKSRDPSVLRFASVAGVPLQTNSFLIPHEKFREGLAKAIQIGSYFAQRAKEAETPTWKIFEISPEFDISISGTLGLVTVTGAAGVELTFGPKEGA